MIYIYLVLGCWLPFVAPYYAETLTLWWQIAMGASVFAYLFIAVALAMRWLKEDEVKIASKAQPKHLRIWLVGLSALLSGHPFFATAFVVSTYAAVISGTYYKRLAK